jgi:hypothetical protein
MNYDMELVKSVISKIDNAINKINEAKTLEFEILSNNSNNIDVISECICNNCSFFSVEYEKLIANLVLLKSKLIITNKFSSSKKIIDNI